MFPGCCASVCICACQYLFILSVCITFMGVFNSTVVYLSLCMCVNVTILLTTVSVCDLAGAYLRSSLCVCTCKCECRSVLLSV